MSQRILDIRYNPETMNVVLTHKIFDLLDTNEANIKELNIDVREYITLENNKYLVYILKLIDKFDFVLRQHIIKFTLNRFNDNESRKATSINTYIKCLEDLKLIKKIKLNNNNYYMLTQKGYIYLKKQNNVQTKRKPGNSLLREKVFIAQYYLEQNKDIEFDFLGLNIYLEAYKIIFNYIKGDASFAESTNVDYINDFIEIENVYRKYRGIDVVVGNGTILENFQCKINKNNKYEYLSRKTKEFSFINFMDYVVNRIQTLKNIDISELYKEIESKQLKTPLLINAYQRFMKAEKGDRTSKENAWFHSFFINSEISMKAPVEKRIDFYLQYIVNHFQEQLGISIKLCENYISLNSKRHYLSSEQYISYQYWLLSRYLKFSEADKRNSKRDELSTLQYSKIYISDFNETELEFIILDMERKTSWYREKLLQIDKVLRRINMICNKYISARFIIYIDDSIRKEYVRAFIKEFIKENKKNISINMDNENSILNYLNDDKSIYFLRNSFDLRLNGANSYLEKGSIDEKRIITSDEIILERLK